MSMSQEEIEALMNGLDLDSDTKGSVEVEPESSSSDVLSQDDIAALMAQTSPASSYQDDDEDLEALIGKYSSTESAQPSVTESIIDAASSSISDDDLDAILAGIDGIKNEDIPPVVQPAKQQKKPDVIIDSQISMVPETRTAKEIDVEAIAKNWTDKQIDSGVFPLPVEKSNKVVNQLHQVAKDGEEQASKIFDVLSFLLDENNGVQKNAKVLDDFVTKQIILLDTLTNKFPHIELFATHLVAAQSVANAAKEIKSKVDDENNHLFEAMELMQFHDINRQKIERVMAVIKRLANYLNNLFEDETGMPDIKIAKHIHGDHNSDLVGNNDLEALIAEFGN